MNEFDCYIFHDVDLILENDMGIYTCQPNGNPQHFSGYIDKFNYRLPYRSIFGGVVAFTEKAFRQANGYSNEYWGWGGEDDDLYRRAAVGSHLNITRPNKKLYRYKMIKHGREIANKPNPIRGKLLKNWNFRWKLDGLNNLKYKVIEENIYKYYINITVDPLHNQRLPPKFLYPPVPNPKPANQ